MIIIGIILAALIAGFLYKGRKKKTAFPLGIMGDSIARRTKAMGELRNDNFARDIQTISRYSVTINTGVGGATTAEIKEQLPKIIKSGVRTVVITGGINDILRGIKPVETVKNMRETDDALRGLGIRVLRLKPHQCNWPHERLRLMLNQGIAGLVPPTAKHHLIDNYHFNAAGKKVVAEAIVKELSR